MKKVLYILLFFNLIHQINAQQDPQFNLYQFNPLIINPAYAGARDGLSIVGNVRNQWVGIDGAPKTNVLSVHSPVLNKNVGIGLTVVNDRMGPRNMIGAYGNFAYILKLNNKWKLSMGLNAGYNRFQFNYSSIQFKNTDAVSNNLSDFNRGALDLNAGAYLRSKTFFVGMSFTHIKANKIFELEFKDTINNQTSVVSYRLRTHGFFTVGKSFVINEDVVFAPTIMFRNVGNKGSNLDLNLNFFLYNKLWLGLFIRGPYGPGFLMQYYVNQKFKVGYSFDMGLKDARKLGPSHEITIGFDFLNAKSKIISPRFL